MGDDLRLLLAELNELKNKSKEEMNNFFDDSSNYPCEYNVADLQQKRYDTICEVLEIVNSFQRKSGDSE